MKSKPTVMQHFSTIHSAFIIDFTFDNNVTILMGDSGAGKTAVFSFIRECMPINQSIFCLNYLDYQKNIESILREVEGKLVVIDNADILLNDAARKYISLDERNQYFIIGRNPQNLFATRDNLYELQSEQVGEQIRFTLKHYL